jgi:alpha-2-macroglobulin
LQSDKLQFEMQANKKSYSVNLNVPLMQQEMAVDQSEHTVEIENKGNKKIYARIILTGQPPVGEELAEQMNLGLSVNYKDANGNPVSPANLEQGQDIYAIVTVRNIGQKADYTNLALTQVFPSGWEIIHSRLDGFQQGSNDYAAPEYEDIRDDRVYSYFDLKAKQSKTFRYKLNAAYLGRFYLPAVQVEAMYDHEVRASVKGKWVTVIKPGEQTAGIMK